MYVLSQQFGCNLRIGVQLHCGGTVSAMYGFGIGKYGLSQLFAASVGGGAEYPGG
jgi:hypothetical protein